MQNVTKNEANDPNVSSSKNENSPTVSKKTFEDYKGKIQEIIKDPAIDLRRKNRYRAIAHGNTWAYKHGRYSVYHPSTPYTEIWLQFCDNLDINDPTVRNELAFQIMRDMLKTYGINRYYEAKDGWVMDKKLADFSIKLVELLVGSIQAPGFTPQVNLQHNNFYSNLTEEERKEFISAAGILLTIIEQVENRLSEEK